MAVFSVTNTFVSGTTITASGHNTNWADVTSWLNNRYNGTDTWLNVKVAGTSANPVDISGSAMTTELSINNTATDGDPLLSFELSGTAVHSIGVDDSDSDTLKFGTTDITTGVSMQIVTGVTQVLFNGGTAGVPGVGFIGDGNSGFYRLSADAVGISTGGTGRFTVENTIISSLTAHTFSSTIAVAGVSTFSGVASFTGATAGSPSLTFTGDANTGIYSGSANFIGFSTDGSSRFTIENTVITVLTTLTPNGGGSISTGDATNYWNDISYKTLTDRGCLGWFDEGVELQDGSLVSDTQALLAVQKHPTKKTIYGSPMLDYKTFPKVSYKKAEIDGVLLPRDENDEPVGGSDGIEMTSFQSIMIGAIKELAVRVAALEK